MTELTSSIRVTKSGSGITVCGGFKRGINIIVMVVGNNLFNVLFFLYSFNH